MSIVHRMHGIAYMLMIPSTETLIVTLVAVQNQLDGSTSSLGCSFVGHKKHDERGEGFYVAFVKLLWPLFVHVIYT